MSGNAISLDGMVLAITNAIAECKSNNEDDFNGFFLQLECSDNEFKAKCTFSKENSDDSYNEFDDLSYQEIARLHDAEHESIRSVSEAIYLSYQYQIS